MENYPQAECPCCSCPIKFTGSSFFSRHKHTHTHWSVERRLNCRCSECVHCSVWLNQMYIYQKRSIRSRSNKSIDFSDFPFRFWFCASSKKICFFNSFFNTFDFFSVFFCTLSCGGSIYRRSQLCVMFILLPLPLRLITTFSDFSLLSFLLFSLLLRQLLLCDAANSNCSNYE